MITKEEGSVLRAVIPGKDGDGCVAANGCMGGGNGFAVVCAEGKDDSDDGEGERGRPGTRAAADWEEGAGSASFACCTSGWAPPIGMGTGTCGRKLGTLKKG